jgi:hypothetical protein
MARLQPGITAVLGALMVLSLVIVPARADHVWGSYHLSRTSNTQVLRVGVNLTTTVWKQHLTTTITDWNTAGVITLQAVRGKTTPKACKPAAGTIQVCNYTYGRTGWVGLAQIWISGGHISQGTAKQNDTYFKQARYNTPAWRQMVICQEVAHTFGLGHVNETYDTANTGSCMDYTSDPAGGIVNGVDYGPANTAPNQHDFDLLEQITHYPGSHTATTTIATALTRAEEAVTGLDPKAWGRVTERDEKGRPVHYVRQLGRDLKVVTFVIPVDEPGDAPSAGDTGIGGEATGNGGTVDAPGDGGTGTGGHTHDRGDAHEGTGETTGETGGHAHEGDQGTQNGPKNDGGKKADRKPDGGRKSGKGESAKQDGGKRDAGNTARRDQSRPGKRVR